MVPLEASKFFLENAMWKDTFKRFKSKTSEIVRDNQVLNKLLKLKAKHIINLIHVSRIERNNRTTLLVPTSNLSHLSTITHYMLTG